MPPFEIGFLVGLGILGHTCFNVALTSVIGVCWQATEKACLTVLPT